jgi:hypothetical protein
MSEGDRDLVAALRAELAATDCARPCDRRALAAGLGRNGAGRDSVTARLAIRAGLASGDGTDVGRSFEWAGARDHCRIAYVRGLFLAQGSLSLAGGRTHLEFVVGLAEAPLLVERLAEMGMPASWRVRRGRGVVTWKSAEIVGTFLRRAGAGAALLELEARQVSRAVRGDLNRVINAESANLTRAVETAGRQLAAIDELESDGRLARQPYVVRAVAEGRRETPEATFGELAERLGIHRSAVQRALERIEWLTVHGDEMAGFRRRRSGPRAATRPDTRNRAALA